MTITLATTDADLQAVRQLFATTFSDIAPDAVPFTREGHQRYDVMVAQAVDSDGRLQGAAMTCRAQIAVTAMMLKGDPLGYAPVIDKHRELDLIAVQPGLRASGVGSHLVSFLEEHLVAAGVEVLFGNATRDLNLEQLRQFYERQGFTVGALGAPLPLLLGKSWTIPNAAQPGFYFYKMLRNEHTVSERQSSGRLQVVPPDPLKARRPNRRRSCAEVEVCLVVVRSHHLRASLRSCRMVSPAQQEEPRGQGGLQVLAPFGGRGWGGNWPPHPWVRRPAPQPIPDAGIPGSSPAVRNGPGIADRAATDTGFRPA